VRKLQADDSSTQQAGESVLQQAAADPAPAQTLQASRPDLLETFGLPASAVADLTIEGSQICLSIPFLGYYQCVGKQ
jgi:hypothetical protein